MSLEPTKSHRPPKSAPPGPGADLSANETAAFSASATEFNKPPKKRIGNFELLECVGKGGMGEVWRARQVQPVERIVALKLIKKGLASPEILSRFELERSALAVMDHPNVSGILEAGAEQGQPYFAMEFAEGVPLDKFCSRHRLTIHERLGLFRQICSGVHHAHQKGVIHRDLKPGNIIVSVVDGEPVAKVIDFGLAKAVGGASLSTQSLQTQLGQILGTPKYMSPEQASLEDNHLDIRSDVYSLGVILFKLLTGTTPIDDPSLPKCNSVFEVLTRIRETETDRPGIRLKKLDGEKLNLWVEQCKTPLQSQLRMLSGELDWISMKSLQLVPEQRYESAGALGNDVRRFLDGEPIEARPLNRLYLLKKFVAKNRVPVTAAAIILLLLIAGIFGTSVGLLEANRAWEAEAERADSEQRAKIESERRLELVENGNAVLSGIFGDLDIRRQSDEELLEERLAKKIVEAHKQLDVAAEDAPLSVANMKTKLGYALLSLGFPTEAVPVFELALQLRQEVLGPENPQALESENGLAEAYQHLGEYNEATPRFLRIWERRKTSLGETDQKTLVSLNNLAECYRAQGDADKALPLIRKAWRLRKEQLGDTHQQTLTSMNNLALTLYDLNQLDEALPLFRESYELTEGALGANHPDTLTSLNNLAIGLFGAGSVDEALEVLEKNHQLLKQEVGPEHPDYLRSSVNLGKALLAAGKLNSAESLLLPTFQEMEKKLGERHVDTLTCLNNLAEVFQAKQEKDSADRYFQLAIERMRGSTPHPQFSHCLQRLAVSRWKNAKHDQAVALFEEALAIESSTSSEDNAAALGIAANLGIAYRNAGMPEKAVEILQKVIKSIPDHPQFARSKRELRTACYKAGLIEQFEARVSHDIQTVREDFEAGSIQLATQLSALGADLIRLKRYTEAEEVLKEAHGLRLNLLGDHWATHNTKSMHGEARLGVAVMNGEASRAGSDSEGKAIVESLQADFEYLWKQREAIPANAREQILADSINRVIKAVELFADDDQVESWIKRKSNLRLKLDD